MPAHKAAFEKTFDIAVRTAALFFYDNGIARKAEAQLALIARLAIHRFVGPCHPGNAFQLAAAGALIFFEMDKKQKAELKRATTSGVSS